MKFRDIPQLTREGTYQVNVPIRYVLDNITKWEEDDGKYLIVLFFK